ncbi:MULTISPECIES: helix-turn-helix transcriptional regulator [Pseudomonas syringae group]|uniref:helix-turn-helix transcriptional regulator n=1 Tax=Pseudomonas syringae group TaxID=136849 RepID=UPI0006B8A567|nr:LuxR C-terminal-related transcriptional regulator [Pseudomonas syringae]
MAVYEEKYITGLLEVFPELSKGEAGVLMMYSLGCEARKIATELNVATSTVNTNLKRMKEKFEIDRVADLRIIYANRLNLLILLKTRFPNFGDIQPISPVS